jgi:hypothetical protein
MSEELDQVFVGLVKQSWKHYNEELQNTRMDDLLVGAVIASTVKQGNSGVEAETCAGQEGVRRRRGKRFYLSYSLSSLLPFFIYSGLAARTLASPDEACVGPPLAV